MGSGIPKTSGDIKGKYIGMRSLKPPHYVCSAAGVQMEFTMIIMSDDFTNDHIHMHVIVWVVKHSPLSWS